MPPSMLPLRLRMQSPLILKSSRSNNGLGLCGAGHGVVQAADDALLAENDHGVEKRRSDSLAHDGHARRVDQQSGLNAFRFGDRSRGVIASVVVPLREFSQGIRELGEKFRHFRIFPEFFLGGGI